MMIESVTWDQVAPFWQENNMLKSDVPIIAIQEPIYLNVGALSRQSEKVLAIWMGKQVIGCVRITLKKYGDLRIAALGSMAIDKRYRRQRVGNALMKVACQYMSQNYFDVSVLWASVLQFYREFGYMVLTKNMMIKFLRNVDKPIQEYLNIPQVLGTW